MIQLHSIVYTGRRHHTAKPRQFHKKSRIVLNVVVFFMTLLTIFCCMHHYLLLWVCIFFQLAFVLVLQLCFCSHCVCTSIVFTVYLYFYLHFICIFFAFMLVAMKKSLISRFLGKLLSYIVVYGHWYYTRLLPGGWRK